MLFLTYNKKIFLQIVFLMFLSGCALYVEDLQKVYTERDGIYQTSENQKTLEGDIFYSSFFNYNSLSMENISSNNDFIKLQKDTIYDSYLANNYYSYLSDKNKAITDSVKITYDKETIEYLESEEEYYQNSEVYYYSNYPSSQYNNNIYYFNSYNSNPHNNLSTKYNYVPKSNNSTKNTIKKNKGSNGYNKTDSIKNVNEYNRRSTSRRRR